MKKKVAIVKKKIEDVKYPKLFHNIAVAVGGLVITWFVFYLTGNIELYTSRTPTNIDPGSYYWKVFVISFSAIIFCGLMNSLCYYSFNNRDKDPKARKWQILISVMMALICGTAQSFLYFSIHQQLKSAYDDRLIILRDYWRFNLIWPTIIPFIIVIVSTILCVSVFKPDSYAPMFKFKQSKD